MANCICLLKFWSKFICFLEHQKWGKASEPQKQSDRAGHGGMPPFQAHFWPQKFSTKPSPVAEGARRRNRARHGELTFLSLFFDTKKRCPKKTHTLFSRARSSKVQVKKLVPNSFFSRANHSAMSSSTFFCFFCKVKKKLKKKRKT